jgi:hypothetical protein
MNVLLKVLTAPFYWTAYAVLAVLFMAALYGTLGYYSLREKVDAFIRWGGNCRKKKPRKGKSRLAPSVVW